MNEKATQTILRKPEWLKIKVPSGKEYLSVKITDTYGNLVYETISEGGQAIWDGYNFDGKEAVSGVYVVFVTNSDGSEEKSTKILIIR